MNGDLRRICIYMNGDLRGYLYLHEYINTANNKNTYNDMKFVSDKRLPKCVL